MSNCWNCRKYSFCRATSRSTDLCKFKDEVRVITKHLELHGLQVLSTYIDNNSNYFWNYHEIEVLFSMNNDKLVFMGGREANRKGDWFWNPNDATLFECEHPGLLKSIEIDMNSNRFRFVV